MRLAVFPNFSKKIIIKLLTFPQLIQWTYYIGNTCRRNVGVYHSRFYVLVTKQLLYVWQLGTRIQQMGSIGMPEGVRRHFDGYPSFFGTLAYYLLHTSITILTLLVLTFDQPVLRFVLMDVDLQNTFEFLTHRYISIFTSFAQMYKNLISIPQHIIHTQAHQLI